MSQVHRPLPPPCGEGSGVGVARCSGSGRMRCGGRFSWPRWIPACAGMTPSVRPRLVPQPPSSPGLTRGSSRPRRPHKWRGVLDGRVKPGHDEAVVWPTPTRLPPPSPQGEGDVRHPSLSPFTRGNHAKPGRGADLALRQAQGEVLGVSAREVRAFGAKACPTPALMVSLSNHGPETPEACLLMVRCERSEPRTMGQVHRLLPPPCGEGSGVGWPDALRRDGWAVPAGFPGQDGFPLARE
jgi:hypothetical protein